MVLSNRGKTLICVTVAGVLFMPAVLYNIPLLVLPGAFFDWLPLPTGWMRVSGGGRDRRLALTHAAITLVAYCLASLWIIFSLTSVPVGFSQVLRLAFIEVWWLAVMVGVTLVS